VQIQAGGDGAFHERLAQAVLAKNDQRNGPFNARAAASVFAGGIPRSTSESRVAHVSSQENDFRRTFEWKHLCFDVEMLTRGCKLHKTAIQISARLGEEGFPLDPTRLMLAEAWAVVDVRLRFAVFSLISGGLREGRDDWLYLC
jgi:hypothetical protein